MVCHEMPWEVNQGEDKWVDFIEYKQDKYSERWGSDINNSFLCTLLRTEY